MIAHMTYLLTSKFNFQNLNRDAIKQNHDWTLVASKFYVPT